MSGQYFTRYTPGFDQVPFKKLYMYNCFEVCTFSEPDDLDKNIEYGKVASINAYLLRKQLLVKKSQYIRIKNPLHKQSDKACMCFKTRRARTRDYTVFRFGLNAKLLNPILICF